MSTKSSNGWRSGHDPIQRWLRIVTTVVVLGLAVYLAVVLALSKQGEVNSTEIVLVIAMGLGAVLILLGYERVVKLPMIGRTQEDEDER